MPKLTQANITVLQSILDGMEDGSTIRDALAGEVETEHMILDTPHSSVAYDTGATMSNMIKTFNSGRGLFLGSGEGSVAVVVGDGDKFLVPHATGPYATADSGAPTGDSSPAITEHVVVDLPWPANKFQKSLGVHTVEGGVEFRIVCTNSDGKILAQTCNDDCWDGTGANHGYGVMGVTVANDFAEANLEFNWPVNTGTLVTVTYTFRTAVQMNGFGTWAVDWSPAWQDTSMPMEDGEVVWYDVWQAKTYALNDKVVVDGTIYRCIEAGAQTGSFAAESSKWTEVGNIPAVMVYKSGISVADFNALTVGTPGWFYRISDTGTLTGGQAAVVGDQVVISTELSGTIQAGEFDYFPNQEPGIIIPPWEATTYALDDVIYEQGILYYCQSAGAQITSFAANVADWGHFSKIDANLKIDTDGVYNIGASGKRLKRVYVKDGVYSEATGKARLGIEAANTSIKSPDEMDRFQVANNKLSIIENDFERLTIDATNNKNTSNDGTHSTNLTNDGWGMNDGNHERLSVTAAQSVMLSPDGQTAVSAEDVGVKNTGYTRLGAGAPFIQMKKITGTTAANEGGVTNVAHGLDSTKIISITCLVHDAAGKGITPSYVETAEYRYGVFHEATNVTVVLGANVSGQITNKPFTILITYEA